MIRIPLSSSHRLNPALLGTASFLLTLILVYRNRKRKEVSKNYAVLYDHSTITVRDTSDPCSKHMSLQEYLVRTCESFRFLRYAPSWWSRNGHLQTFWAGLAQRKRRRLVDYEREYVRLEDGGEVALDWFPRRDALSGYKNLIFVLHGLVGGSHEAYIQELIHAIHRRSPEKTAFVVFNQRGCSRSTITTPRLFHAGATDDLDMVIHYIRKTYGWFHRIQAVGFSLGGNILVKYLGEQGDATPFSAAACVCNPFDLVLSSQSLHCTWIGKYVYSRILAKACIALVSRHKAQLQRHPSLMGTDWDRELPRIRSIFTFDDRMTARCFGFKDACHYYEQASSARVLKDVRTPLLCLNDWSDPIAPPEAIPWEAIKYVKAQSKITWLCHAQITQTQPARTNRHVLLLMTEYGGHIGWYDSPWTWQRWSSRIISDYLLAMFDTEVVSSD